MRCAHVPTARQNIKHHDRSRPSSIAKPSLNARSQNTLAVARPRADSRKLATRAPPRSAQDTNLACKTYAGTGRRLALFCAQNLFLLRTEQKFKQTSNARGCALQVTRVLAHRCITQRRTRSGARPRFNLSRRHAGYFLRAATNSQTHAT